MVRASNYCVIEIHIQIFKVLNGQWKELLIKQVTTTMCLLNLKIDTIEYDHYIIISGAPEDTRYCCPGHLNMYYKNIEDTNLTPWNQF